MCLINKAGGEQADTWPYDTSSNQVAKLSPSPDDISGGKSIDSFPKLSWLDIGGDTAIFMILYAGKRWGIFGTVQL